MWLQGKGKKEGNFIVLSAVFLCLPPGWPVCLLELPHTLCCPHAGLKYFSLRWADGWLSQPISFLCFWSTCISPENVKLKYFADSVDSLNSDMWKSKFWILSFPVALTVTQLTWKPGPCNRNILDFYVAGMPRSCSEAGVHWVMETSIEVLLWMSIPAECNCRTDWRTCLPACAVRGSSRTPRLMLDSGWRKEAIWQKCGDLSVWCLWC